MGGSNTPDFILASYLAKCLENFEMAVCMRDKRIIDGNI